MHLRYEYANNFGNITNRVCVITFDNSLTIEVFCLPVIDTGRPDFAASSTNFEPVSTHELHHKIPYQTHPQIQ